MCKRGKDRDHCVNTAMPIMLGCSRWHTRAAGAEAAAFLLMNDQKGSSSPVPAQIQPGKPAYQDDCSVQHMQFRELVREIIQVIFRVTLRYCQNIKTLVLL